jgi:hypothetical protein
MNILQFISALVASVAWPVTLVVLVWLLRDSIQRVLLTITSLKYKDLQVDFGRELKELEEKAKVIDITPAKRAALPPPERKEPYQILADAERLVNEFPEPAVALAWSAVETELLQAVMRLAISADYPPDNSAYKNVKLLSDQGTLDANTIDVLNRLRNLRNAAVHGGSIHISTDEAREYIAITKGVVDKLKALQR